MGTRKVLLIVAVSVVCLAAVPAFASIEPLRTVQVPIGSGGEQSLQSVLNGLRTAGTVPNTATEQVSTQIFNPFPNLSNGIDPVVSTMVIEIAGNANSNRFGIYSLLDPSKKVEVFAGTAGVAATANVTFVKDVATSSYTVTSGSNSRTFASVDFGLYLDGPGGIFYSQDVLNSGKNPQALIYSGANAANGTKFTFGDFTPGTYIVGWEDLPYSGADKDYQDMVVFMSSLERSENGNPSGIVPEPAALLVWSVLGLSSGGVWVVRRRRAGGGRTPWSEENRTAISRIIERGHSRV